LLYKDIYLEDFKCSNQVK